MTTCSNCRKVIMYSVYGFCEECATPERLEIAQLREALTQANALYNTVEAKNLDLTDRIEAMQADAKLSDMAWKDNQAALKTQAETIARLEAELAQCKHALDDEGDDGSDNCARGLWARETK